MWAQTHGRGCCLPWFLSRPPKAKVAAHYSQVFPLNWIGEKPFYPCVFAWLWVRFNSVFSCCPFTRKASCNTAALVCLLWSPLPPLKCQHVCWASKGPSPSLRVIIWPMTSALTHACTSWAPLSCLSSRCLGLNCANYLIFTCIVYVHVFICSSLNYYYSNLSWFCDFVTKPKNNFGFQNYIIENIETWFLALTIKRVHV